jgi:hypothetical protein
MASRGASADRIASRIFRGTGGGVCAVLLRLSGGRSRGFLRGLGGGPRFLGREIVAGPGGHFGAVFLDPVGDDLSGVLGREQQHLGQVASGGLGTELQAYASE